MKDKLLTFGERLRAARKAKHLNQQWVAEYCGETTYASVSHWEAGRNFPSLQNLVLAAELYDVSIDWLVWGGEMGGIDSRVRKIPAMLRPGLIERIHKEIDETEKVAARLPKEMIGDVVKDADQRLKGWSAANLKAKPPVKKTVKKGTQ